MSDVPGAPRGRGTGRARGRGRGGGGSFPRGGAQAPPLAAQLRQLDRLQEPEELAVLRRYKDLGASQIRSTYGLSGLLDREVLVSGSALQRIDGAAHSAVSWISLLEADNNLQRLRVQEERERALSRRESRLPSARHRAGWADLSPEERRILLLSQKEYNSFRARSLTGARPAQRAPNQAGSRPGTPASRGASPARQPESAAAMAAATVGGNAPSNGGGTPPRPATPPKGTQVAGPSKTKK